jgi:peroxiredoxin Q/BCP
MLLVAAGSAAAVSAFAPAPSSLRLAGNTRASTCSAAQLKMLQEGEKFPADAAVTLGVKNKNAVVYFYGADGSPSCTKQAMAFDSANAEFKKLGFEVVGVRSDKESKGEFANKYSQRFVSDVGNGVRQQLGIKNDLFGFIAGRETYVINKAGTVEMVFNNQLKTDDHVEKALAAATASTGGRQGSFVDDLKARIGSFTASRR